MLQARAVCHSCRFSPSLSVSLFVFASVSVCVSLFLCFSFPLYQTKELSPKNILCSKREILQLSPPPPTKPPKFSLYAPSYGHFFIDLLYMKKKTVRYVTVKFHRQLEQKN